jgi:hypothetical protein
MITFRAFVRVTIGLLAVASTAAAEPSLSLPGAPFQGPAPAMQKRLRLALDAPAYTLSLEAVTASERAAAVKAATVADKRLPLQIGFARSVPAGIAQIDLISLDWQIMSGGGHAARIVLESPEASAIRAELVLTGGADGLMFRFRGNAPDAQVFGPYTWAELEAAARWTPVLEGSSAILDIEVDDRTPLAGKILAVPRISHLSVAGAELAPGRLKRTQDIGRSGSCNIDIACVSNPTSDMLLAAAAAAQIVFTESGNTFLCSGTLVNSRDASGTSQQIPYFVTAHHCVGSSTAASTINFYWFFQAATCESRAVPNFQVTAGGASLLYTSYDVDLTFLRMNNNPPQGTFLAGWDAAPVFPGVSVISLHHPQGDLKKYSAGQSVDFAHDFDDVQSPGNFVPQGMYLRIAWSQGTTEPGSSGGGVYTRSAEGLYQLRGVLHGGDASCQDPHGLDYFSRLDLAYPSLSQYLAGVSQPAPGSNAIEYYNVDLDHYFLTSFPDETQSVEAGAAGRGWVRTGYSFKVGGGASPPLASANVCRFYGNPQTNPATGKRLGPNSHFYTADAPECAQVRRDPGWVFETGNAFTVQVPLGASCPNNTLPVFRVYNNGFAANNSNHRYTTSLTVYEFMLTQKWSGEQTVMCAPAPAV